MVPQLPITLLDGVKCLFLTLITLLDGVKCLFLAQATQKQRDVQIERKQEQEKDASEQRRQCEVRVCFANSCLLTYIHTYIHAYIHACMHGSQHESSHAMHVNML